MRLLAHGEVIVLAEDIPVSDIPPQGYGIKFTGDEIIQFIPVAVDIKFLSNPNAFNCKKGGVVPMTIFGTAAFNVADIDLNSLRLARADGVGGEAGPPVDWSIFDRGDPADAGVAVDGVDVFNPDGFDDLDAAFDAQAVADLIGCDSLSKGDASPTLVLTGEHTDGTPITSSPVDDVGIDQLLIQNN